MSSKSAVIFLQGCAAVALAVAACAGTASRKPSVPVTTAAPGPDGGGMTAEAGPSVYDPRLDEIVERDKEIRDFRRELDLDSDPSRTDQELWMVRPLSKAIEVCPIDEYPQTPKCQDVCTLADHICENADAICDLAEDLKDNDWAQRKCASAKASCKDGKKRCCTCNGDEPHDDKPGSAGDGNSGGSASSGSGGSSDDSD